MHNLNAKVGAVLDELSGLIINFVEQDRFDDANFFLGQYIKLAPTTIERYSLEALVRVEEADWQGAKNILEEGLTRHPLSFDLLYNLGYILEKNGEILEAYNVYMKARYIAGDEREKEDIAVAMKRLVPKIVGTVKSKGEEISTVVRAGDVTLTITTKTEELLERKKLLGFIEKHIAKNMSTVLEIGFMDGIISKNLNYFGYDVTAVDCRQERILNIIAKEWHDNLLQPKQKVAKFYHSQIGLKWMHEIPEFDAIIAVANEDIAMFNARPEEKKALLEILLKKARKQLFLRVAAVPSVTEFSKVDLVEAAALHSLKPEVLAVIDKEGGQKFELCLVNKHSNLEFFAVPEAQETPHSPSTVFDVSLEKCTDMHGAGYVNDWHHFVEVLKDYQGNPALQYSDSVLKGYYERFCPKNQEEALFVRRGRASQLRPGWIGYPWYWDKSKKVIFEREPGETRPGGNHHFGPSTDKFGRAEFGRLVHLYNLLKQQGYHPELFSDGYISGYLLLKGSDYRFVVSEGQHRIACLAALGYEKIRCRFTQKPEYPRTVVFRDVKKWPQVANGVYSRNLALKVFERFFAEGVGR
ncbi:MAG: hypothetical protein GX334_08840, partial [Firmicutes bacterium]|nr:hypothetical protein [Bacillota bacterium]